jgi:hypothetical protein
MLLPATLKVMLNVVPTMMSAPMRSQSGARFALQTSTSTLATLETAVPVEINP